MIAFPHIWSHEYLALTPKKHSLLYFKRPFQNPFGRGSSQPFWSELWGKGEMGRNGLLRGEMAGKVEMQINSRRTKFGWEKAPPATLMEWWRGAIHPSATALKRPNEGEFE